MIKIERFYNFVIALLLVGIFVLVIFKFVLKQPQESFGIKDIDQISVNDLVGNIVPLAKCFSNNRDTYILIFDLKDCFSCIYRGLEELKSLKNAGKTCFGLIVDDYYQDLLKVNQIGGRPGETLGSR
ncbi:MAG: hypothetical protein MUF15_13770, partial [Acidobacteria bacterium]|nr:hypothetical protein [Acidobacteriota bacterium]